MTSIVTIMRHNVDVSMSGVTNRHVKETGNDVESDPFYYVGRKG